VGFQTSYETVLRDASVFTGIKWYTMIADEAHRFKSVSGQTRSVITRMSVIWKLLLTGGLFLPSRKISCGLSAPDQALKPTLALATIYVCSAAATSACMCKRLCELHNKVHHGRFCV
jgi:hypothetical protein